MPSVTATIRRIAPGDEALLERVADDVFDRPIDPTRLRAFLAEPRHLMVLAITDDGLVVGQARAIIHLSPDQADELYIDNMGVDPAFQRRGLGGGLLDELLAWGKERGCDYAWLGTETDNVPARGLYASRGGEAEEMVFFTFGDDPGHPEGVMARPLSV
jgi:aminoglycoside 6'-N-acetyltransferase I